jgi:hypothetical protein
MRFNVSWLPDLVKYDPATLLDKYYDEVYSYFKDDFIHSRPVFQNKAVGLQVEPIVNGKEQTFHHITTEGEEPNRTISIPRCERILWNKSIIEANHFAIKIWKARYPKNQLRTIIWFEEKDYVIILREAREYCVFITAYPIDYNHTKRKLRKSYEDSKKAETAP